MTLPHEPTFLPFQKDWHQADIIAALRKKGTSLAAVSREAGLSSSTLANALSRPWAKGEMLIGKAIGVPASTIWPSRYFDSQTHQEIERPMRSSLKE
ncbi:helix-turn-helix transcriptional regulator [Cedecea sp. FDAARGOS_727]|uniref:helix-turn-helix domain-containing protein n=1 Tax=Cedecea sp. FDAARGOS_727 TaxID=2545798 RepID=UPI00143E4BD3|nr:helix-turn-helix transcriptional regulator [Cedecea sp. FDAARGOS_727]QIX94762.1 transcriptional regulator [Cedecea sp. FDAARGOS_727]